jgi:adenosylcobinamide-GDP ribazoletransferase
MAGRIAKAFFMCMGMFTAIPLPWRPWDDELRPMMTACLPGAGLVVGGIWLLAAWVMKALCLNAALAAALLVIIPWLLTGAIHIDGYMDTADAVLSWRTREERLRIIKDPHTGSFAVIALGAMCMVAFGAAWSVMDAGKGILPLMLIPVASRACSAFCVCRLKPLAHSEYAARRERAGAVSGAIFAALALTAAAFIGWAAVVTVAAVIAGYALAMTYTYRIMDGFSGDLAGCALVIGECCGLIAMAIM